MCVTFVVFISSDHKITNTTNRRVAVFHLAPQLTDPLALAHQGLFLIMPYLPILEPREGLVLIRIFGHGMVANTGGVHSGVYYNTLHSL